MRYVSDGVIDIDWLYAVVSDGVIDIDPFD